MAASPGFAPSPSASETDALLKLHHKATKMVVREGYAPSIAGCRPAVILFHHRTKFGGHERTCTAKARRLSTDGIC